MEDKIQQAIIILNQGGIVVYPTDTAFGVGCRIDMVGAIKRLFLVRKRPETQATPVLVDGISMAKRYWRDVYSDVEEKLLKKYWPGGLTVILPCQTNLVPEFVRGGTETLGFRMPNHPTPLALISGCRMPVLGPSANFHGDPTPYSFESLNSEFMKLVDYVLPGECQLKKASTVIDCSVNPWKILRQGAVKLEL